MLLYLLRPITRLALRVFFRKIDVRGHDRVPAGRPLILVANHPNVMLDALLLGVYAPGARFLGKSTLFRHPLHAWFLRRLGVIPVARAQDEGSEMSRNRDMLRHACQTLRDGHSLVVFPEGASHAEMRVRDLKPGTARIALKSEAEVDGQAGVCVVPVGLTYLDPGLFRGDVFIHFGEAIEVRSFLRAYREDRGVAERALTASIHERLLALTRHIEDADLEAVIRDLSSLYAGNVAAGLPDSAELSRRVRAEQEIIRAVRHFAGADPELVRSFARRLRGHRRKLRRLGLGPDAVASPRPALLPIALLLSPLALYGFLHNALPYYLPRLFAHRESPEMIGTVKMVAGIVLFPLSYLILTGAAYLLTDLRSALLYGITLPTSGLCTLFYDEHILRGRPLWQGLVSPGGLKRLSEERAAVLRDLDAIQERYRASLI